MSKQYKGKTCVYCAALEASSTGDHVVARSFFSPDERDNLPQVPACERCNGDKSALETYLSALLPLAARHQDDVSGYWADSRRRIDKNQRLHRELSAGAAISSRTDDKGKRVTETTLPIDSGRLLDLARLIAKGLLFHHWQVIVPKHQIVHAQFMNEVGESNFADGIANLQAVADSAPSLDVLKTTGLIHLGKQTVAYEGFFVPIDAPMSMWRLNFYQARLGMAGVNETTSSLMMFMPGKSGPLPEWIRQS